MSETAKPIKLETKFGGIEIYTDKTLPADMVVVGYPDGRGGFKDGWVKVTNVGASDALPNPPHLDRGTHDAG